MLIQIKKLLIQNRLEEAFLGLMGSNEDPRIETEVTLLYSRLNSVEKDFRLGIISLEEKNVFLNRIKKSTLELISELGKEKVDFPVTQIREDVVIESIEKVSLKFIHFQSGTLYNFQFPIHSKGISLVSYLKNLLEKKHKVVFKLEDGKSVSFGLFVQHKDKTRELLLHDTLENQDVQANDLIVLKVYPSK